MALPIALALLLLVAPWLGLGIYWNQEIVLTVALALMVSGLNLSLGYAGELALGQVFVYAVGAYVSGNIALHVSSDLFLSLLVAIAAALVIGVVSGIPGLRLGGWALAMTSFFLVLLIPDLVDIFSTYTGGTIGLIGIPPLTFFGHPLDANQYYAFAVVVGFAWFAVFRNLVISRHGPAFLVLRQSPVLASSLGISVRQLKLKAYALGAVPCGIAGVLFANLNHFISPSNPGPFTITTTFAVLAASVLGGPTSVYGAVVGAAIIQLGPLRVSSFQQYSDAVDGAFLVLFGVLLSGGLAGIFRGWLARFRPAAKEGAAAAIPSRHTLRADIAGAALEVDSVAKRFGGNTALVGGLAARRARSCDGSDRAQRIRQDDPPQPDLRLLQPRQRAHQRGRHSDQRTPSPPGGARRRGAHVSDPAHPQGADRGRDRGDGPLRHGVLAHAGGGPPPAGAPAVHRGGRPGRC